MTINPTLPPTIEEFRAAFPEFDKISDPQVQLSIDTGMQWIDTYWFPIDAKLAAMYAAAHYLYLRLQAGGGALSETEGSGGGGGDGGFIDPELGKIWTKSVRFRDRQVTYERVGAGSDKSSSGGGGSTSTVSSAEFWQSSPYGQLMLSFRRRNVPHVAVI